MVFSDLTARTAKPKGVPYKLFDSGGLFLLVTATGARLWRLKYRYQGKEKLLSLGSYPEVSLADARDDRDAKRKLLKMDKKDPSAERRREALARKISAANTFKIVAEELIEKARKEKRAASTLGKARWFLSLLEGPLGDRPVAEIEPAELLDALQKFEALGHHETANRLRSFASRVFRYAVATARAKSDPARDLRGALTAVTATHHAAILDAEPLGGLLRAIDGFQGQPATKLALRLAPHVFVRPGELRRAEWSEFNLDAAVWRIPAGKTKMRREHAVPLSRQSVAILKEAQAMAGKSPFAFPSLRSLHRPMSENTINAALRRLGYGGDEMTGHGFRATASTLLNESCKWSPDAIERALAHKGGEVRGAYHRGAHWKERVEMAQWWSDYLDTLRKGADIVPLRRGA